MARLLWDQEGSRTYEHGVDRVVVYPELGVPSAWSGVTQISEKLDSTVEAFYLDGIKYAQVPAYGEYSATIEAVSYPTVLNAAMGFLAISPGLFAANQRRSIFGLVYRSFVGDGLGGESIGYKLHLVYGAVANVSLGANATNTSAPEVVSHSWELTTVPPVQNISHARPTAHLIIDSRFTTQEILDDLEDILYGSDTDEPRLPDPSEIQALFQLPTYITRWLGTPNASQSELIRVRKNRVLRTNLVSDPKGTNLSHWRISGSEVGAVVTEEDGKTAVEIRDKVGSGSAYIDPLYSFTPRLGQWIACGYDVRALDPDSANNMRMALGAYSGTALAQPSSMTRAIAKPRVNLVPNPTFKVDTTGWGARGGTLMRYLWPQMWPGQRDGREDAGQLTSTGIGNYLGIEMNLGAPMPVLPGRWIAVSGLVAGDSSDNVGVRMDVVCQGTAYTYHTDPTGWAPAPFYAGRRITWAFQAPATASGFTVRAQMYSGSTSVIPTGRRLWLGDVHAATAATEAEALAQVEGYFDGSTPNTPDAYHIWDGTPHASTSRELRAYERLTLAAQVSAYDPAGFTRTLVWPLPSVATPNNGFRIRNVVVSIADTKSAALESVETFFDGDTLPDGYV